MTLDDNPSDGVSRLPKRPDEDLPWVLEGDRLENWSNDILYEMDKSFREWLFKAMKNSTWKVPPGRGKWNIGSRMTFDKIREQFNIEPQDYEIRSILTKLCKHYATKVKVTDGGIKIRGKQHSRTGYYFPRNPKTVKKPYSLRLKFEMMIESGEAVTDLRQLRMPASDKKTIAEMNNTRKLQNAKAKEYARRWREKYGDRYDYSGTKRTHSSSDEDTDS